MTTHYSQDESHQNWTARPKHNSEFWTQPEKEPHWAVQVGIGILIASAFILACFAF